MRKGVLHKEEEERKRVFHVITSIVMFLNTYMASVSFFLKVSHNLVMNQKISGTFDVNEKLINVLV